MYMYTYIYKIAHLFQMKFLMFCGVTLATALVLHLKNVLEWLQGP